MSRIMAYCGLLCNECPAYKATVADDMAMREETARAWGKMFGVEIDPGAIHCLGCDSGVLFEHCKVCEIRACAREKALDHCGRCADFACVKVEKVLKYDEGAKERLSKKDI